MAKTKKKVRRRSSSLILGALDSLTGWIYSAFANGRGGSWLSSGSEDSESSFFVRGYNKLFRFFRGSTVSDSVDLVMKKSRFANAIESISGYLASLSLSFYGLLLLVYGVVSIFVYFIPILLGGQNAHGDGALITVIIISICAIPMTVATRSLQTQVSESRFFRSLVRSFLAIPEEKLKPGKRRGGAALMLFAALIGLALAGLTYFWHPVYIAAVFGVIAVVCVISANPESGVALTLFLIPFLQYVPESQIVLAALIALTVISYTSKVFKRRRVFEFAAEELMVIIFCGFIFASSIFSAGGISALEDSFFAVIIIIGAFFMSYNLMRGNRLLRSFVSILGSSFVILAFIGVVSVFYNGIVDGVTYSVREYVQPILEGQNLYIVDNSSVFSVLAVLSFPILFAFMAKRKSVRGAVGSIILAVVVLGACFVYGSYETIMAIVIEACVFWILYSHKTVNVVTVILIPIAILVVVFPFIASFIDVPAIVKQIESFLPISFPESSYHIEIGKSTWAMLKETGGIGAGESAFKAAIEPYLTAASSGAENPGNFYLQIICWSGFGGIVAIFAVLSIILKNSLGFLAVSKDKELRVNALALFCGLFGAVLFGGINCLWEDARMLYLFWAMLGALAGYVKEGKALSDRNGAYLESEDDSYDVELRFYK